MLFSGAKLGIVAFVPHGLVSATSEQFQTIGGGEAIERHVPFVARDRLGELLHRPADAHQPRAALFEANEVAVVMALAPAEPGPFAIDRDKGNEHQVRLNHEMPLGRLHDPEETWLERVAGVESERLSGIGEAGISDDRTHRARFLGRGKWADLRPKRAIAADDRDTGKQ